MAQLPEKFIERISNDLGEDAQPFMNAMNEDSPISIRINPRKNYRPENLEKVAWCNTGYYLPQRPVFTLDPLFHAGAYYVQEASSMFLEQALKQSIDLNQPLKVLDLCAAPGGKSTHLASLLSDDSLLVSNEVIRSRAKILAENITKWGNHNVVVTSNDASNFKSLDGFFDVIVIDAPCSGEGLFRKDDQAANEWSEENVNLCALRQRRIVADVWSALKPDGLLIYSTCTYNQTENDENIAWIRQNFEAQMVEIDTTNLPQISLNPNFPGYHFYPHKSRGEGFFMAVVQKTNGTSYRSQKPKKSILTKAPASITANITGWLNCPEGLDLWMFQDKILAFPKVWSTELLDLINKLSIVQCGIEVCEVKAKNLLPSPALAFSPILNISAFTSYETDRNQALLFLKKEDIKPTLNQPYLLVTHQHFPLGWLKNAGNRYNNLYPKEWRIRMDMSRE